MAQLDLATSLGPLDLRSPLVAASGTVGAVVDQIGMIPFDRYGAAVAKSVSADPWHGKEPPRLAPAGAGMLNAIGVQNPGVEKWLETYGPLVASAPVPVIGSAIGRSPEEYVTVAKALQTVDLAAIELNLSCPNVDGSGLFALHADASFEVVAAVRSAIELPIGAKLSPNAQDIGGIASAAAAAGADWVVLTNTVWGAGIDVETRAPVLSAVVGGLSGPPLKPIALRCVIEVHRATPELPIVGCGGVRSGHDVVEFLLAGASAVAVGTAHFESPKVAFRICRELDAYGRAHGVRSVSEIVGAASS